MALARRAGWIDGEANALGNLGFGYVLTGPLSTAVAYLSQAIELHRQFVRKAIREWGFDGFKMDTVWGGPPCYAKEHHHASPEEAAAAYPRFFRVVCDV